MKTRWLLGTIGFGYKDWQGGFYPPTLPHREYLTYYSQVFNAVELDTTFYGTPSLETIRRWYASVPPNFKFCAKTPRAITHELGLAGARGLMDEFLAGVTRLEEKLGGILIQMPPRFSADYFNILQSFLAELPKQVAFAIEFRHPSWYNQRTADLLTSHGACWVATEFPNLPDLISRTADFLYIRWIGQHGKYDRHTHERVDLTAELTRWLEQIRLYQGKVNPIYGFFNNDYAGFAAGTCQRFMNLAGIPIPDVQYPQQQRLF